MEPFLTATSEIRSPRYYRRFFFAPEKWPYMLLQKKPLIRSLVNTGNDHILKSQTAESFIISPRFLHSPLVLNVQNQSACNMSILSIIVIYLVAKQPIHFTTLLQRQQHFSLFSFFILTFTWAHCRAIKSLYFHHKVNRCTKA